MSHISYMDLLPDADADGIVGIVFYTPNWRDLGEPLSLSYLMVF